MGLLNLNPKFFKLELNNKTGIIRLNRPPANAHNLEMLRELDNIVTEVRFDDEVDAVILTSAIPKFFSAGFDIAEIRDRSPEYVGLSSQYSKEVLWRMMTTRKLFIAAINGHCMGGGLEIAMACDLRYSSSDPSIKIGMPEINLGLIPGEGGTQMLGRIVGKSKALYLMVTGKSLSPKEAHELGIVDFLVEPEKLLEETLSFASQVSKGPLRAIGFNKLSLNEALDLPLPVAFSFERELQNQALASGDAREGAKAFLERRTPQFKGK